MDSGPVVYVELGFGVVVEVALHGCGRWLWEEAMAVIVLGSRVVAVVVVVVVFPTQSFSASVSFLRLLSSLVFVLVDHRGLLAVGYSTIPLAC